MPYRKFEIKETTEGKQYLLDGEEIRHVVECELDPRDIGDKCLLTLKVAVSNYGLPINRQTGEKDSSYHKLLVKMEGAMVDDIRLDEMDLMIGLVGFGIQLNYGKHGTVATLVMIVTTDKETAKQYGKDEEQ